MALPNYVKFLRGTITAYNRLPVKDDNTLYFVYQDGDESKGKLYLGSRLISGDIGAGSTTLADLTDVIVDGADAGSFLVLNSDGDWVATSAADIAQTILEAGGNFISVDQNEFNFNNVNGNLEIKGYSTASVGMIPVKGNDGITWQAAPIDLSSRVGTLEGQVSELEANFQSIDGKISTAISNANHLKYEIINSLADAADENVVYLYQNNSGSQSDRYDEYMMVNGLLERIGSMTANMSDYVLTTDLNQLLSTKLDTSTFTTFQSNINSQLTTINNTLNGLDDIYVTKVLFNNTVGDLDSLSQYSGLVDASISDTLEDIYERLVWQEIRI